MDISKNYVKKSLFIIIIFMALLTIFVDSALYFGFEKFLAVIVPEAEMKISIDKVNYFANQFASWFIPISSVFFAFLGFLLWLTLKIFLKNSENKTLENNSGKKNKKFPDQRLEQEKRQRLFLYTLSILQREGRLLDFFDENLNNYDDEQIGMAVRSIQEDCKKAMNKYISLKPIYDTEEGATIELGSDFDPDSVKLIGNVAGKPPFKGILKHRGWKAGKKEIPKLSEIKDATIISPAEIEIK